MKVLYVERTSLVGGGERSLLDLFAALPSCVVPTLACPAGRLAELAAAAGVPVVRIPGTSASLRLHPWQTSRALIEGAAMAGAVHRQARRIRADLIHANSIRAGLACVLARKLGASPVVVSVRDCLPEGRAGRTVRSLLRGGADRLVANSNYTATNFTLGALDDSVRVLHSPVDLSSFDPNGLSRAAARARLGIAEDAPLLAVVAQITPWKAQDDAIRILAHIRERYRSARLLLIGEAKFVSRSTRYDNLDYRESLHGLARELGIESAVIFMGERTDVPEILRAVDIVLVPSWEEPFGRSVVEGMAMGTAVMATSVGGPSEIITDGVDGVLLPPKQAECWARAAIDLLSEPERRAHLGTAARQRATSFNPAAYSEALTTIYSEVVSANETASV